MAEPRSASLRGRWSLAVLRPPSLHCQRCERGTCSGRRLQGCSYPPPSTGEAAAIPAPAPGSRCRQQHGARGRRCCLRSAAASGSEHESARPRLLLHAQLLCKCFFLLLLLCFFHLPVCSRAACQLCAQTLPRVGPVLEAGPCCPSLASRCFSPRGGPSPPSTCPRRHRGAPSRCRGPAQGHSRQLKALWLPAWCWEIAVQSCIAGEPRAPTQRGCETPPGGPELHLLCPMGKWLCSEICRKPPQQGLVAERLQELAVL